jgi:hypothetical protein
VEAPARQRSLLGGGRAYLNEIAITSPCFLDEDTCGGVFVDYGTQYDCFLSQVQRRTHSVLRPI